jgi:hypothetical protein
MAGTNETFSSMQKLHMESIVRNNQDKSNYLYTFITFNTNNLKGPFIKKIGSYNIYARAIIPINDDELFDMTFFTDKQDKILDFHMTYLRNFKQGEDALSGRKFDRPLGRMNIRADIGPSSPPHPPYMDVQIFDRDNRIMARKKVVQDHPFATYECVISAVLMQIEKLSNPLIGPQYWLSPMSIHPERVFMVNKLRSESRVDTPLCVVSRIINIKLYEETAKGTDIDDDKFRSLVLSQLRFIKDKEEVMGGWLDLDQIPYTTEISVLPFLFFKPDGAELGVQAYFSNGSKIPLNVELLGLAHEMKGGYNTTRGLNSSEKSSFQ